MRRVLLGLLLVSGCTGGPAPEAGSRADLPAPSPDGTASGQTTRPAQAAEAPSLRSWTSRSADGRAVLTQVRTDSGCRVEATVAGSLAWQFDECAATGYDLVFVAPDGERWLVLFPQPARQGHDWSEAVVAVLYRRGAVERRTTAAELVAKEVISQMQREESWLRGVGSGSDAAPRYAPGGAGVLLQVADGAHLTLGFGGEGVPGRRLATGPAQVRAVEAASAASEPPGDSIWTWEDAEGGVHYDRWEALSAKARKVAKPVTEQISTVRSDAPRAPRALRADTVRLPPSPREAAGPSQGPRLNGLTDAERERMSRALAQEAERKREAEEAQFRATLQRDRDASAGFGPVGTNPAKQDCTRVGDRVECRNAAPVCKTVNGVKTCRTPGVGD